MVGTAEGTLPLPTSAPPDRLLPRYQLTPPYTSVESLAAYDWSTPMPFGTVLALRVTAVDRHQVCAAVASVRRAFPVPPIVLWIDTQMRWLEALALTHDVACDVHAVRFEGAAPAATLRATLTDPYDAARGVTRWLHLRGIHLSPALEHFVAGAFEHALGERRLRDVLQHIAEEERTAPVRALRAAPPLSEWLHVARAVQGALRLQADPELSLRDAAEQLGYDDEPRLSNAIHRAFQLRPGAVRQIFGWEWLLDRWIANAFPRAWARRTPFHQRQSLTTPLS